MRRAFVFAALLLASCASQAPTAPGPTGVTATGPAAEHDYDILIKGGTIYDGSGGKPYVADIGVKDGLINAVYPKLKGDAAVEIDARGKAVAPGFIGSGDLAHGFITLASCPANAHADESLPVAVRRLTSDPALRLHLKERGRLMPGWAADILVFEPKDANLGVTPANDVIVDGVLAVEDGRPTGGALQPRTASCD